MNTPIDTVRGFYDALGRGEVPRVLGLLQNELEWTEAERFPYYSGNLALASRGNPREGLSSRSRSDWDGFSANGAGFHRRGGARVVSLGTYSGTFKGTGKSMTAAFAHVWAVRDGRIAKFDMHTDTAKVLEALQG